MGGGGERACRAYGRVITYVSIAALYVPARGIGVRTWLWAHVLLLLYSEEHALANSAVLIFPPLAKISLNYQVSTLFVSHVGSLPQRQRPEPDWLGLTLWPSLNLETREA